jgi:hypothetical protein
MLSFGFKITAVLAESGGGTPQESGETYWAQEDGTPVTQEDGKP